MGWRLSMSFRELSCVLTAALAVLAPSCREQATLAPRQPLPQRAYVWQRDWRAPVMQSLHEGRDVLDGCVVLATEVEWRNGQPRVVRPDVDWNALQQWGKPVSAALRIASYPGPFHENDEIAQQL